MPPESRFLEAAADPSLVPGIYNACDQWCDYCPATARCLAFRCRRPEPGAKNDSVYEDLAQAMRESMLFLKRCHEAEGLTPPDELLQLLEETGERPALEPIDDPLERMGRRYAVLATAFLATWDEIPQQLPKREHGPTPEDVFVFYHVLIAIKIGRALSSSRTAARAGGVDARLDADRSAKVALVAIDRSDEALQVMGLDDPDPRVAHLRKQLRMLRREVEGRFPDARRLVRAGLDE